MPLMRAMVGLPMFRSRSCISMNAPIQRQYWPLVAPIVACSSRSAPVQKARSPAPVTATTAMASSHEASSKARPSSRSVWKSKALRTGCRSMVTVATPLAASLAYRPFSKPRAAGSTASGALGSAIGGVRVIGDEEGDAGAGEVAEVPPALAPGIRGERLVEVGSRVEAHLRHEVEGGRPA